VRGIFLFMNMFSFILGGLFSMNLLDAVILTFPR
jgi:hypothetical protein